MFVGTRFSMGSVGVTALLLAGSVVAAAQSHPVTRWNVKHDVSAPLSEMIKNAPKATSRVKHEAEPLRRIPLPPGLGEAGVVEDSVRQRTIAAATPPASLSFEGLGNAQYGFTVNSAPPDTNGAVGATQYFQLVNSSFAIFNKATGALVAGPTTTNTLWSGFGGGCQTNDDGDGIALYDKLANRWVISQFSVSTTPFLQCVAVSTTSDATGTYNRYSFQYSNFDDYPKMGVWPDGYYTTFNMFNGNTFVGADACAYNRTAMLAGTAAQQVCFQQGSTVGGLLPADLDGTTAPPAGSPNYQVFFGTNSLQLFKFHVDFTTPANSTYTGPTNIAVAAFSPLCAGGTCVKQPTGGNQLDSLADRLMFRLAYRNLGSHESLVVNHSIVSGTSGGVRWYEIQNPSGTPVVAQQSTFAPDSTYRWMGSIAMDQSGDIALGYSVSSSSVDPSVRFTGRLASDPVSTMGTEVNAVAGGGVQNGSTSNGPLSRWGDYSSMTVDPVDDCTFWYTQEYIKTTGSFNWNTRIASFKFPSCGGGGGTPAATLNPTSLTFASQNVGTTSAAQTITLTNSGTAALSITSIAASGDYVQTNTCGTSVAAGANCTISVKFTPTAAGTRTGTITVTDNASGSPQTASLMGTGVAGAQSFTVAAAPASLTVNQGATGTSTITVASQNGFNSATTLSFSGLPSGVTASFATNPVTPPANGSATSVLTFTASATATTGTVTVTVTGTSGTLTQTATISLTVATSAPKQLLGNPGFENGTTTTPWTLTAGVINNSSSEPPHGGVWDAWMDGYGTTHTDMSAQTVTIPSTVTTATLSFWLHINTAETTTTTAFDTLSVQVLNTSGTVLATLGTFSNLNHATGYQQHSFSVIAFKGQTVQIRFTGTEDTSLQTSFVLDDTALNVQ
jgi:Abnormal spindle-like microcephaly-assoc'd, ASPM-SPD-2-Hydin